MKFITARRLQPQFQLPVSLAREMVIGQTQYVLRHRWQPRAWLRCWFGWQPRVAALNGHSIGLALLMADICWFVGAQWLAGLTTLVDATDKARRLKSPARESSH